MVMDYKQLRTWMDGQSTLLLTDQYDKQNLSLMHKVLSDYNNSYN